METTDEFAVMFGGAEKPAAETPKAETAKEETPKAETPKDAKKDEKKDPGKAEPFPKKDVGMGGAYFCDQLFKTAPDWVLEKIKSGEKSMAGCWNWVYSHVRNEYVRENGKTNGGFFRDVAPLVEQYFREIPEGTVEEEAEPPKPKYVPPVPAPAPAPAKKETAKKPSARKSAADRIVAAAVKAAEDAKKEDAKSGSGVSLEETLSGSPSEFSGVDFSAFLS